MKKVITSILVVVALTLAVASAATITFTNLILQGASGGASTNYGTPVYLGSFSVLYPPTINHTHTQLSTTNAAVVFVGIGTSTASNTMTIISTNYPTTTNTFAETIAPGSISIPIYLETVLVTTNNNTNGTTAIFVSP